VVLNQESCRFFFPLRFFRRDNFSPIRMFRPKMCFIFVQRASSAVFSAAYALLIPLFHKLFNKTVENFRRANREALL
jgi:hypothetical protein